MANDSFHVYQMPTMANPEAFSSLPDLRRELHRTNRELMNVAAREQHANEVGQELMQTLYKILLMYLTGSVQLAAYLEAYLEERPRLREKLADALEEAGKEKVH
jgi:hypothetical protein